MKITNRAMAIALNRSLSCGIKIIRDATLINAVENIRSATTRDHASSTTTGTRTGVSGECLTYVTPMRFRIVKLPNEKPMHVGDISRVLDVERHLIGMHLDILELYGFVSSERVISKEAFLS